MKTIGYAANTAHAKLRPHAIDRRDPEGLEIQLNVLFCGVCHSDVHQVRNEWKNTVYPCMPGHEIVGRVTALGASAKKFKVGDLVGVGCMIDSCHRCAACKEGLEQYCEQGALGTYNGNLRTPSEDNLTFGGYSERLTVREDFVLRIPAGMDPASTAPILCAGVTTYSPLKHWKVGPGVNVGIIGLGGLGQMAIKLATAMGAEVTAITRTPEKAAKARTHGATAVIISTEKEDMEKYADSFDFILSTIPQPHDVNPYMTLIKRDGVLTIVGCLAPLKEPLEMSKMIMDRKTLGSSLIGGIKETQEVLDFCAKHKITSDVKVISVDDINDAFDRVDAGDVDFRYVIDIGSLKGKTEDHSLMEKVGL